MARTTRVDACDPELPPLEMIRGMKRARTTARAISSSNRPMAEAVKVSPTKRAASHPARFLIMLKKPVSR